jgi:cell shape-determining protein MreC
MRKKNTLSYFFLFAALLLLMSLPVALTESAKGAVIALFAPVWEQANNLKRGFKRFFEGSGTFIAENKTRLSAKEEVQRLQIENHLLLVENERLQDLLQHERHFARAVEKNGHTFLQQKRSQVLPARVIFRSPSTWNSSLWLDVGKADNALVGKEIVAKNSPVIINTSLIGVVDYVGQHQCRVRLLTDSGFTPSVRAARGMPQNRLLIEKIDLFLDALMEQDHLFSSMDEKMNLVEMLELIQKKLRKELKGIYLAKGELHGSSSPQWRSQGQTLKGIGFNYDYADKEGPARDLRTGEAQGGARDPAVPLLKVHDVLVTTGMDGVFPAGLNIAEVIKINPLKEGDYYYELEAKPTAGNLDELSLMYVIPPLGYDSGDQAPLIGWES